MIAFNCAFASAVVFISFNHPVISLGVGGPDECIWSCNFLWSELWTLGFWFLVGFDWRWVVCCLGLALLSVVLWWPVCLLLWCRSWGFNGGLVVADQVDDFSLNVRDHWDDWFCLGGGWLCLRGRGLVLIIGYYDDFLLTVRDHWDH